MCVEPELQPVQHSDEFPLATSNTQDSARLDVAVNGFWGGRSERCFMDVRVFNPFAPSNSSSSLSSTFRKHEKIKHRAYGQRVREVEHATFTPIVLAATGGLAHEATVFYKRLASFLATKWGDDYSVVLGWLRCCLSFSLLRSAIQCIRWGTVFHWCLHQDSTVSGLSDCGIPFVCLILFSCPALAICAGGGRKGQSIKPWLKK